MDQQLTEGDWDEIRTKYLKNVGYAGYHIVQVVTAHVIFIRYMNEAHAITYIVSLRADLLCRISDVLFIDLPDTGMWHLHAGW